ncbi:MAG: Gfo/Idh/MocA family oxidoreductase, partial [Rhodobiaceae bacterium]|nr:Gfo/Idh/MocA family oxidoreductase [Rhodobiaceae bacterium]
MSHGMEHWHPNPDFFFKPGAGPVLDVGPYYVTNLIQLLGPVARIVAMSSTPAPQRVIGSKPRKGQTIDVETPTTVHGVLEFESGAVVTLGASWDVWQHGHRPMELYGEKGTLLLPDPNYFGGKLAMTKGDVPVKALPAFDHPFGKPNESHPAGRQANYRAAGLADMAQAILDGRPHRCSAELALHAVDVMTALLKSGETGRFVKPTTTCERPEPLGIRQANALLKPKPAPRSRKRKA